MAGAEAPYAVQVKPTVELTPAEIDIIHDLAVYSFNDDFPEAIAGRQRPSEVLADVVTENLAAHTPRIGGPSLRDGQTIERRYTVLVSAGADDSTEVPAPDVRKTSAPEGETTLPEGHGLVALASFSINASSRLPRSLGAWHRERKMQNPDASFVAAGLYIVTPSAKRVLHTSSAQVTPFDAALVQLHASGVYDEGTRKVTSYPYRGHKGMERTLVRSLIRISADQTGKPRKVTLDTDYIEFWQQRWQASTLAKVTERILARPGAQQMLANMYGIQL